MYNAYIHGAWEMPFSSGRALTYTGPPRLPSPHPNVHIKNCVRLRMANLPGGGDRSRKHLVVSRNITGQMFPRCVKIAIRLYVSFQWAYALARTPKLGLMMADGLRLLHADVCIGTWRHSCLSKPAQVPRLALRSPDHFSRAMTITTGELGPPHQSILPNSEVLSKRGAMVKVSYFWMASTILQMTTSSECVLEGLSGQHFPGTVAWLSNCALEPTRRRCAAMSK